jgi:pSer/pThr/pTyr-binding forkhead associated (FHA) protein
MTREKPKMQNFQIETQGADTYLVYRIDESDTLDSLSLGMVTNNHIKGIAPILLYQMDANKYLKYRITAKRSVATFFEGAVTRKRLLGVFSGIADAILSAEEYMIDTTRFIFDLDYVFVDVTTCETLLICLPIIPTERSATDLSAFFKQIVFNTQFDQTENTDYVAKIISYLNGTINFSLVDFAALLKRVLNEGNQPAIANAQPKQQVLIQPPSVSQPMQTVAPMYVQQPVVQQVTPVQRPVTQPQKLSPPPPPPPQASQKQASPQPFAIPNPQGAQRAPAQPKQTVASAVSSNEPEISFLYLMQHYNKENKAAYDAQKAQKKAQKEQGQQAIPAPPKKPKDARKTKGASGAAGAVPFAIPGQHQAPNGNPPYYPQPAAYQIPQAQPQPMMQQPAPQQTPVIQQPPQQVQQPMTTVAAHPANFGETTVLNNAIAGSTTVLGVDSAAQSATPHLVRIRNNERISLNKPVFRIGKEKSFVDYFIGDNTAISRSHADFTARNGEYFVTDMNSTNHTYVNGVMIQSSTEVKLAHGARIKLANEEFEFRLY